MNSQTGIVSIKNLNVAGEVSRIPVAGFLKLHISGVIPDGTTASSVVVALTKSMFGYTNAPSQAFSSAVTLTASEFNSSTIEADIDVSDAAWVVVTVSTPEGSDLEGAIGYLATDEGA